MAVYEKADKQAKAFFLCHLNADVHRLIGADINDPETAAELYARVKLLLNVQSTEQQMLLLDQIFNFSYAVITAVLAECVVVMRWHDRAVAIETSLPTMPESEKPGLEAERHQARQKFDAIDRRSKWLFPLGYAVGCIVIVATHLS